MKILVQNKIGINLFILFIFSTLYSGCKKNIDEGKQLATTYCVGCHQLPDPGLLPKNVWKHGTLPNMSIYMGIKSEMAKLKAPIADNIVLAPKNQLIGDIEWEKIKKYYLENAPEKLEIPKTEKLKSLSGLFEIEQINVKVENGTIPNYTYVGIDKPNNRIFASDQTNKTIWIIDKNGQPLQQINKQNAISNIDLLGAKNENYLTTFIGSTTQPNPDINGSAVLLNIGNKSLKQTKIIFPKLNRPTAVIEGNFDDNIDNEIISCEYGFINGKLSIWKKDKNNIYQEKILNPTVGAMNPKILDFDGDKKMDILVQFAQGNERIVWYKNLGNLTFEEKNLVTFPASYGSSNYEIVDLNKDGKLDIVCTTGDNADFSTILKPYHGVYIFSNIGNNTFKQTEFYYQNGAYKVLVRDFDNDGDLDMVSISEFPDQKNRPEEGFIFFENNNNKFTLKTIPIDSYGRWNVMDASDLDSDGDIDIVLGSHPVAPFPSGFNAKWKEGTGLIILRNNTEK